MDESDSHESDFDVMDTIRKVPLNRMPPPSTSKTIKPSMQRSRRSQFIEVGEITSPMPLSKIQTSGKSYLKRGGGHLANLGIGDQDPRPNVNHHADQPHTKTRKNDSKLQRTAFSVSLSSHTPGSMRISTPQTAPGGVMGGYQKHNINIDEFADDSILDMVNKQNRRAGGQSHLSSNGKSDDGASPSKVHPTPHDTKPLWNYSSIADDQSKEEASSLQKYDRVIPKRRTVSLLDASMGPIDKHTPSFKGASSSVTRRNMNNESSLSSPKSDMEPNTTTDKADHTAPGAPPPCDASVARRTTKGDTSSAASSTVAFPSGAASSDKRGKDSKMTSQRSLKGKRKSLLLGIAPGGPHHLNSHSAPMPSMPPGAYTNHRKGASVALNFLVEVDQSNPLSHCDPRSQQERLSAIHPHSLLTQLTSLQTPHPPPPQPLSHPSLIPYACCDRYITAAQTPLDDPSLHPEFFPLHPPTTPTLQEPGRVAASHLQSVGSSSYSPSTTPSPRPSPSSLTTATTVPSSGLTYPNPVNIRFIHNPLTMIGIIIPFEIHYLLKHRRLGAISCSPPVLIFALNLEEAPLPPPSRTHQREQDVLSQQSVSCPTEPRSSDSQQPQHSKYLALYGEPFSVAKGIPVDVSDDIRLKSQCHNPIDIYMFQTYSFLDTLPDLFSSHAITHTPPGDTTQSYIDIPATVQKQSKVIKDLQQQGALPGPLLQFLCD